MARPAASPWSRTARTMRERVDAAIDHMADVIKDALLDGLDLGAERDGAPPTGPLPAISPDEFVEQMRGRVEEVLRRTAHAVNAAPGDALLTASEEETCDLFTALWLEALKTAAQMRLDAALAEKAPDAEEPEGEWARRYRRMHAEAE
jgi:hypothetical protein